MVDARLPDGSRINAIIPPLAIDGPALSIRKFSKTPIDLDKLVGYGSMTADAATVLRGVVSSRRNVLISGGTGSGKTTMLNALSASIDGHERIVTIEDSAEAAPCAAAGDTTGEHRGPRRGEPARPGEERAAYAARPDHPGRNPLGRGVRHAAGNEHRP
jgi:hypothetical protein